MGRYYYGDIEGKFMFGVQDSNSADRFGVLGQEPSYLEYFFAEDDLDLVQEELKKIENTLGINKDKIMQFFNDNQYYQDEMLAKYLELDINTTKKLLSDFADYRLGKKIEQSILENGQCSFTAEL